MSNRRIPPAALRVLHLFRYFRPDFTGEGLYLEKLAPLLAGHGIRSEVAVAAQTSGESLAPMPGIDAVHRLVDPGPPRLWGNGRLLRWLARHARDYDVLHLHGMVDRLFLPQLLGRLAGCRVVQSFTLDDSPGRLMEGYRPARRQVARLLSRSIGHGVAISPRLADDALRVMPPDRLWLIPQGVATRDYQADQAQRAAARGRFGFGPEHEVLLYVGSLCARKAVAELVDGFAQVRDRFPLARLLVVGPALEPDYADALHASAARLGPQAVRFTGYLDNPAPAYAAADAFVFASRQEGFGNVLIEAMAAGLPVLARRLPGVTDSFIADGQDGLLFDSDGAIADGMARLLADPALRARLGAAARTRAAGQDLAVVAGRYAALYRGLPDPVAQG